MKLLLLSVAKIVKLINRFQGIPNGNIFNNSINVLISLSTVKRKLERFVNNTIVVKNPIPDQLVKPVEARLPANTYMNKDTN